MPNVTGNLTDVGGGHLVGKIPEIHFTLNSPNAKSGVMLPTQPVTVQPESDGSWTANLQATTDMLDIGWYTVSIQWLDAAGNYVKADFPDWKLEVPTAGGTFSNLFGRTPTNTRMVYVALTAPANPRNFTLWLQKDPTNDANPANTGNLYEWRGSPMGGTWNYLADVTGGIGPQGAPGDVSVWKPSTNYLAGQKVLAPNGSVVSAKAAFTSGLSYDPANWVVASQDATLAVAKAAGTATVRNVIVNSAPHFDNPAWFVSYGTSGAGTRTRVLDAACPSGIAYLRHAWTTSATSYNAIIRTASSPAEDGKTYAGSIWVRSSIDNVIGAVGYFYDAGAVQLTSKFNRLYRVKAGVWTRIDVNGLVAPAGTVAQRLGVGVNSAGVAYSAGDTLDVSAACVVEGSTVFDWFDGSFPNAYWAGAIAASDAVMGVSTQPFGAPFTNAPSAAGARTGRYSTSHLLYLPSGADIGPMRRRIAQALAGQNTYRLAAMGHSIVAGQGGTPGTLDTFRLFQQRAAQAGKAVTGMVTAVNNTTQDARVTFDPEWASIGTPRGNMQLHRRCLVAGKSFTYASDTAGTVVQIYTFGNGSAVTYSIDGGAPVTITPTGASAIQITTVTGLADTKHTVVVTSTTTTAAYLLGISVHSPNMLEIGNFGYSGSVAADWRSDYFTASQRFYNGYNDAFTNWAADGAVIDLGANELIHGFTSADLETNLGNIVSTAQGIGKDIVLVLGTPVEDATRTTWFKDYVPAVYNVADLYKVPLIDLSAYWINRAVGSARGLYYDQWHPNNQGYFDLHGVFAKALLP